MSEPKAAKPKAVKPKAVKPKAVKPKAAKPKAAKPKAAKLERPNPGVRKAAPRSLILPPKSTRPAGRVAPLSPRMPAPLERLAELGSGVSRMPPARRGVLVTQVLWQRLQTDAAHKHPGGLSEAQRAVIAAALGARDSLVVMADDARATACYELCAPLLTQPTLVLAPAPTELRARADGAPSTREPSLLFSTEFSGPERSAALTQLARGGSRLVFLSPEALACADVRQALTQSGIGLFVVEEAHCASDEAHELRPSYAALATTLRALGRPPVMAVTRAASAAVVNDIRERLELSKPVLVSAPLVRENLRLVTRLARGEARQASLVRLVERLEPPGLVLCATSHDTDSVYGALQASGIAAHRVHGGMTVSDRAAELLNHTRPDSRSVLVAVSAFAPGSGLPGLADSGASAGFGRGAGRPDLRFLVHYQSPASLEQYVREVERAGVDGAPATCVLFYESSHRSLYEVTLAQQRFRAAHLAELGRVLEPVALEERAVNVESLALATGQSRRTTDRLTALLADAGVITRTGGCIRVIVSASDMLEVCRNLGAKLYALREQDAPRLGAVAAFAESTDCKLAFLDRYFGTGGQAARCGRCSACEAELVTTESMPAPAAARRPVVQEFSVRTAAKSEPAVSESAWRGDAPLESDSPLLARLADFGESTPRGVR